MLLERAPEYPSRLVGASLGDCVVDRVEHQGDAGQRLDRTVVQLECEPPPFVLLRRDPLLELPDALSLFLAALALAPLERRISQ